MLLKAIEAELDLLVAVSLSGPLCCIAVTWPKSCLSGLSLSLAPDECLALVKSAANAPLDASIVAANISSPTKTKTARCLVLNDNGPPVNVQAKALTNKLGLESRTDQPR